MITDRQQKEIKKRMRAVKDAVDEDRNQEVINKRVKELTNYLHKEGIINPFKE